MVVLGLFTLSIIITIVGFVLLILSIAGLVGGRIYRQKRGTPLRPLLCVLIWIGLVIGILMTLAGGAVVVIFVLLIKGAN